jgi:hypothetical protein
MDVTAVRMCSRIDIRAEHELLGPPERYFNRLST